MRKATTAERARAARAAAGLRQIDAAMKADVSLTLVALSERGAGYVSPRTAERLAVAYGIRPTELLRPFPTPGRRVVRRSNP